MLPREENDLITLVGPGTPLNTVMRSYWLPALLSQEIPEPDCAPVRVRFLGEDLVAFRDSQGRVGLLDEHCPHRGTSLFFGTQRRVRLALHLPRLENGCERQRSRHARGTRG